MEVSTLSFFFALDWARVTLLLRMVTPRRGLLVPLVLIVVLTTRLFGAGFDGPTLVAGFVVYFALTVFFFLAAGGDITWGERP